jgi:hypothetical protein
MEACLAADAAKACHLGCPVTSFAAIWPMPTSDATSALYCEFVQALVLIARRLCATEPVGSTGQHRYALDSTTIDLCLTLFPSGVHGHGSRTFELSRKQCVVDITAM